MLVRIAEGDEDAFYLLYTGFRPMLYPFVRDFARSLSDTEDILQEIFLRVWLSRDKLPDVIHIKAWIFKVAARACSEYLRKQLNYSKRISAYESLPEVREERFTPFDKLEITEMQRYINGLVDGMPVQRRRIYQLSRLEGKKPAEIAAMLSLSVGTVKNVLTTAVREIREGLLAAGYPLSAVLYLLIFIS